MVLARYPESGSDSVTIQNCFLMVISLLEV